MLLYRQYSMLNITQGLLVSIEEILVDIRELTHNHSWLQHMMLHHPHLVVLCPAGECLRSHPTVYLQLDLQGGSKIHLQVLASLMRIGLLLDLLSSKMLLPVPASLMRRSRSAISYNSFFLLCWLSYCFGFDQSLHSILFSF